MDNRVATWAPRPALVVLGWALALASAGMTVWTATSGDRTGAALFGVGVLVFGLAAGYGSVVRPRLAADAEGLRLRTLTGSHHLGWDEVRVRLVTTRRFGRDVDTLELDSDERAPHLHVLGWLDLGADPHDVLDVLHTLRR